jgi:two-component system, chemotaxis family, chemotaxis protein CheY
MGTTLVIVDDDAGFRRAARELLEAGGFRVVGEAADVLHAASVVAGTAPEAVLVDVQLPDGEGFTVAEQVGAISDVPVVLVSGRDRRDYGARIAACGARGFLDKADLTATALQALIREGRT